ncbi:hypothetical protein [Snodgrassella alvi]|nr:hypothetical protein [Snodgrassella alvi]
MVFVPEELPVYLATLLAGIDVTFLAWFPSIQDALDDFLDGK